MSGPVWVTPAGFLGTLTERRTISIPVVATTTGTNLSYSVISGSLPIGVYLNTTTGVLLGTPVSVALDTETKFVIRAQDPGGIVDRTFSFVTTGTDAPVWVTGQGVLPVGLNGEFYAVNQQYIDYTLRAETDILVSGNKLRYYIADNQGQLPPGVRLTEDGRILGYVEDSLILDSEASIAGGYDTEVYDQYPYEHNAIDLSGVDFGNVLGQLTITNIVATVPAVIFVNEFISLVNGQVVYIRGSSDIDENDQYFIRVNGPNSIALYLDQQLTQPLNAVGFSQPPPGSEVIWGTANLGKPQFINKTYQFRVTVTDGIASEQRLFSIDVIDRNSLRVDNTFLSIDSDFVDSSAGYMLAPIWQSKYGDRLPRVANLGSVRSGRDQIISIYDYDPYPIDGPTIFNWSQLKVNPDIKLYADSGVNLANLPTRNLRNQSAIYFRDAEIIPVKGMQIQLSEYVPGSADATIYTITGVIKLSETSGVLNINQPLSQFIPDGRIFYVGTPSRRPLGLQLDPVEGTIYGKLAYQPSYSDGYRFTVQVTKIDQAIGNTNLYSVIGNNTPRIVGRRFFESITTDDTAPYVTNWISEIAPQLIDPAVYALDPDSRVGDIFLVDISDNVVYNDLLSVMGGTTQAFVFTGGDVPEWGHIGETVTSNQIYILNVLGQLPSAIQWISTSSVGNIASGEISELFVKAVNTNTNYDISYELVAGELPQGLVLNSDGTIQGKITNTGQTYFDFAITTATFVGNIVNNTLTISTVTGGSIVLHQNITSPSLQLPTFTISGSGNVWDVSNHTTSSIVTTVTNTVTNLESTIVITAETPINVTTSSFTASTLSPNAFANQILTLDGSNTTVDQNWYFTVRASDAYRLSAVEKEFYITVNTDSLTQYTRMYVKPFMSKDKRSAYRDFITDLSIFDPALIYRSKDPEFGVQKQIKMLLETGIEKIDINEYAKVMQDYFYRKRFYFGEVKSILAQDNNGNDIYEIIYVDIVDDQMIGKNGVGVSVANMQSQLEGITIDGDTILVDERLQPKYMTTLNPDTGVPLGFIKAVPLCYTIPGGSVKILSRISNALRTGAFSFNQFNFDTDRIVIETVKDTEETGWLFYPTDRRILPEVRQ
jgi:hypothetical protein